MVKDSVREELETKINRNPAVPGVSRSAVPFDVKSYAAPGPKKHIPADIRQITLSDPKPVLAAEETRVPVVMEAPKPVETVIEATPKPVEPVAAPPKAPVPAPRAKMRIKYDTSELTAPKTSPTLVGFQPKNPVIPDWRLELQNKVRGRHAAPTADAIAGQTSYQKQLVTNGANALKAEYVEAPKPAPEHKDPRVASALKRINDSRKAFMPEASAKRRAAAKATPNRNFPFNVVEKTGTADAAPADTIATVNVLPKPKLVSTFPIEKKKFDTNKLPPIEETLIPVPAVEANFDVMAYSEDELIHVTKPDGVGENIELAETTSADIDDLAPFAMRFNSGVFDLIIGGFGALVLLSPVAFFGGDWMSLGGLLTFTATWSIVMFVYLTVCIGVYGRTLGMRLFSLEIIDADENEYPTFHQAAVSSAVYLLSLPLFGASFVTIFFNEEKRAAHDLLSGTIIVNEF
ncbi:MAG TPA: RDD family protein [Pyrinomonadaceae bacterium]|nr:RDD family protein [Pyrinomonadaceae bacterium]